MDEKLRIPKMLIDMEIPKSCAVCDFLEEINGKKYCGNPVGMVKGEYVGDFMAARPEDCPIPDSKALQSEVIQMTNEQAIELIMSLKWDKNIDEQEDKALSMAIEALKETDMGLNNGDHLHPFGEPFGWTEEEIQKHGLRELLKDGREMKTTFVQEQKGKIMTERKTIYLDDAIEAIRKLPNAGIHWFVSAEAVFDALLELPSAKEESELGEWVYEERKRLDDETDDGPVYVTQKWWTCSKCGFAKGFMVQKPSERYCPMCGNKKKR